MSPDEARAMYRDQIDEHGEPAANFAIRRYTGVGSGRPFTDRPCRARVTGYAPSQLVGSITQGDRRIIVLAEDLEGESPPFTINKNDKAVIRGIELGIVAVDDNTKRIAGVLVAYELQARG